MWTAEPTPRTEREAWSRVRQTIRSERFIRCEEPAPLAEWKALQEKQVRDEPAEEKCEWLDTDYAQVGAAKPDSQAKPEVTNTEQAVALPLWKRLVALAEQVPDEAFVGRPTDMADQHDHYVYGTPKRR
jgi:hypothetical protein